ncbi:MAG: class I SAM-dependent methyltransferase [Spirochaetota bacterium]
MSLDLSRQELTKECPLDGSCDWNFLYHSQFSEYNLPIYACSKCKLQALYPRNIDYQKMYGQDYYEGRAEYSYYDERKQEVFASYVWDARLRNIAKYIQKGNFLDIGCSFGGFLQRAQKMGFRPYGVEVSQFSAEYAQKRGIEVYQGNFLDLQLPENFFDVITMIEVIEHLEYPQKIFSKLSRILKPGGLLLLQTANFSGKQAVEAASKYHYYLPGHVFYYTCENLQEILRRRGFTRFIPYYGVDFSLLAKLRKSRGTFTSWQDYWKWWRIAKYHWKSKLFPGSTSSMVLYAFKGETNI